MLLGAMIGAFLAVAAWFQAAPLIYPVTGALCGLAVELLHRFLEATTQHRGTGDRITDEPKKRSTKWIWWTTAAILLLLAYPLSMGPVMQLSARHDFAMQVAPIYYPIGWAARKSPAFRKAMNAHLKYSNAGIVGHD